MIREDTEASCHFYYGDYPRVLYFYCQYIFTVNAQKKDKAEEKEK